MPHSPPSKSIRQSAAAMPERFDWRESARQFYGHILAQGVAERDRRSSMNGPVPFPARA